MEISQMPASISRTVRSFPLLLLRLDAAAVFAAAVVAYASGGHSWRLFAVLFLAPDLSMLGYLGTPKTGAIIYNAAHTIIGPALLGAVWLLTFHTRMLSLALIWLAHIGFDRMLGYGLKYQTGFGHTHLAHFPNQIGSIEPK